jgi:hypothetical protein
LRPFDKEGSFGKLKKDNGFLPAVLPSVLSALQGKVFVV